MSLTWPALTVPEDKAADCGLCHQNNADKRQYVLNHAARIEHRTLACSSLDETLKVESELAKRGPYLFPS